MLLMDKFQLFRLGHGFNSYICLFTRGFKQQHMGLAMKNGAKPSGWGPISHETWKNHGGLIGFNENNIWETTIMSRKY